MKHTHRIPLLADHHTHPSVYGAMRSCLDLRNVVNKSEALELIRHSGEELIFGLGWNDSHYSFGRAELDELPPVFICNTSLHGFVANRGARRRLEATHPEIVAGLGDQDWVERNLPSIFKLLVAVRGCDASTLTGFYDGLLEQGIWSAEEMLLPGRQVITAFEAAGLHDRTLLWADPDTYRKLDERGRGLVHGIKLFTDGALGARTAAMSEPLRSGERGILLYSDTELRRTLIELAAICKPLAIHAIGDRASAQVIDAVGEVWRSLPESPPVRMEHAEFITLEQARRARSLGIALSMQPNFSSESLGYADRLTAAQCAAVNPFRMLIDEVGYVPGKDLLLGSDGMPHGAATALQTSLFPPNESQRLTLDELIAGYCLPDTSPGSIAVEIDDERRQVTIRAISPPRQT